MRLRLRGLATELQWQELLRTLPVAVYMTDAAGWISFYNDAAATLWGTRPEIGKARFNGAVALLRLDGSPLPHEEGPTAVALRERRPVLGEIMITERPDGSRAHVIAHPTPLFNAVGDLTGAVNILIDVTEKLASEQAMLRLAAIVESSDDAILSKDLDGTVRSWNAAAERLFGYAAEEIVGRPVALLVPRDRREEEAAFLTRIRAGERIEHFETLRRRKDCSLVEVSWSVSPLKDATGRIIGASTIVRDITERRRAQERQETLLHEMSHRVKNLFALSSAIVSLSGKAGGSAQDLIKAVQGRLGALSRAHELTLAGLKADNLPAPTTLLALIRTLVSPFECSPGERVSVTGPEIPVSGDAITPLALVFHELATNAAKYGALSSTDGSIGIELEVIGPELRLTWSERGGPPPDSSLRTDGFGTRLIDGTVTGQLRGTVAREWPRDGLVVVMTMPMASLGGSGSAA
jgi:PAS domain S-box-containing protein